MSVESAMAKFASGGNAEATTDAEAGPVDATEAVPVEGDAPEAQVATEPDATAEPNEEPKVSEHQIQAAKLELIREKAAEAKAKREAQRVMEEANTKMAEAEQKLAQIQELQRDWTKLPDVLGVSPLDVLNGMADQATKAGTPEAQIEKFQQSIPKLIEEKLQPALERVDTLEAQLREVTEERDRLRAEHEGKARAQQHRQQFGDVLSGDRYAPLREEFEDDFLWENAIALGKMWHSEGKTYTIEDIAEALLTAHKGAEGRRRREPAADEKPRTVNGAEVKAGIVGNSTAAGSTAAPRLSRRERIRKIEERVRNGG